jgi:hypothetical protein
MNSSSRRRRRFKIVSKGKVNYLAAYLNSGSILSMSFVPPGSTILLSTSVCTENLNSDVVVMKSAKDRV